ncbi:MAG: polysaccharide lyase family 7 protein [Cytophagales bacterium]|nr:polysaccharide lyase family 7 protein [Cytophagales bacterium]
MEELIRGKVAGFMGCSLKPLCFRLIALLFIWSVFGHFTNAQELDTSVPPSGNFDLSYWKLTRPNQQEVPVDVLSNGFNREGEFYTDPNTGAMVFWCPNDGMTGGSTYPRNELREMIRREDNSIPTQGINGNNWVFSSSTMENQQAAGGVDGVMTATLAVDHVSETSDEFRKVGRTIVGQIHASDDEPCRLYYRKLPGHTKGSIYVAHEPTTSAEQWYDMIGSRSDDAEDPEDGIALGEKFSYEIKVVFNTLTVTIMREGKEDVVQEIDMTDSGFANDWMYFKAGNYNQNNAGDVDEYAQVSFFALDVSHSAPVPPTEYAAPSDIPRFQPFLAECKLQAPTSSTLRDKDALNDGYTHPEYFYVVDGDKILFHQSGESMRTELRNETNWDLTQGNRSLHGRIDIVEQTCDQVTVMQIHDDANVGDGPNKPLLRIYKHQTKAPANHIWAAIKTDDGGVNTTHIDLGEDPGGYFNCDIRLVDGNMIIDFEGEEKVNMDVSFWTFPSYWKAGVYLQDNGEATAHFDELFEENGEQQNRFPSISITSPANNTNFEPGSDITITAEAEDSDGTITKVEFFEGGDNKIGEVASAPYSFTLTGYEEGAYTFTARATDNEGGSRTSLSTNITVSVPVDVTGVNLEEIDGAVAIGGILQLEAAISPADATNQIVNFVSEDESIATVSEDGLVTGISAGTVTITVTTDEGGYTDTMVIQVLALSTELNWALGQPIVGSGTADGANVPANLVDGDTDSRWSVRDFPQSATVDLGGDIAISQVEVVSHEARAYQFTIEGSLTEDGTYSTLVDKSNNSAPGSVAAPIVGAIDNVVSRFIRITVTGAQDYTGPWVSLTELRVFGEGEREEVLVTGVVLDQSSIELLEGETQQLTATISPSHATNKAVRFSSSDASVANVDENGLVTAITAGTATITVTTEDGGYISTTEIIVISTILNAIQDTEDEIVFMPNPANATVSIQGAAEYDRLTVYDQSGMVIMKINIPESKTLDIGALKAGIYLVKLEGRGTIQRSRIIKR